MTQLRGQFVEFEITNKKDLTEADIRTKFITPALVGPTGNKWNVMTQLREEIYFTKGRAIVRGETVRRGEAKKADYILYFKPGLPIAVVEAKDNTFAVGGHRAREQGGLRSGSIRESEYGVPADCAEVAAHSGEAEGPFSQLEQVVEPLTLGLYIRTVFRWWGEYLQEFRRRYADPSILGCSHAASRGVGLHPSHGFPMDCLSCEQADYLAKLAPETHEKLVLQYQIQDMAKARVSVCSPRLTGLTIGPVTS